MSQKPKRTNDLEDASGHVPRYAVGVVAERVGVPIATLRSWNQRYGVGPSAHSPGRHRLYSETDIAMVEKMYRLISEGASPRSAALVARGAVPPRRADTGSLLTNALNLDHSGAMRLLEGHLRHYGVIDTWNELIRPVFSAIEVRQARGEECIDVEHALSWAVSSALQRLPGEPSDPSPSTIILAGAAGEAHTLALEALHAALAERGRDALMLGANTPTSALIDAIGRSVVPATLVLWAHSDEIADAATAEAVLAHGAQLLLVGAGWKSVRTPVEAVRLGSLSAAVQLLTATP